MRWASDQLEKPFVQAVEREAEELSTPMQERKRGARALAAIATSLAADRPDQRGQHKRGSQKSLARYLGGAPEVGVELRPTSTPTVIGRVAPRSR